MGDIEEIIAAFKADEKINSPVRIWFTKEERNLKCNLITTKLKITHYFFSETASNGR